MKLLILPNIFGTEVLASSKKGCPIVGKNQVLYKHFL